MEAYIEHLIYRAQQFWALGQPEPVDLGARMIEAGLNPEELRDSFDSKVPQEG